MLERFAKRFQVEVPPVPTVSATELLGRSGGTTIRSGLYRIHTPTSAARADALVRAAYPEFTTTISCFGHDWLGRQFSLDARNGPAREPTVLMFEVGTGGALEIPVPFSDFHDIELVDYPNAALAAGFFDTWLESGQPSPSPDQCIGYRIPLFLGGEDDITNLEVTDLDVYWSTFGQIRVGLSSTSDRTAVAPVDLRDMP
ncbi:T6SS immunity protein Tdi1 domain-containing protein [Promicromonospora sp. NPDC052451]|uniref:T6SS immunity protein Tdi1 domain-containing protein n=1 Tax=unclassified Promicromonospora TaxID=2647929 RepID=UPI0037C622E4